MRNWISLVSGIGAGFLVLVGLYLWVIKGDTHTSDIMLTAAASLAVLVGSTGFGDRKACAVNTQ